LIYFYIFRKLQ